MLNAYLDVENYVVKIKKGKLRPRVHSKERNSRAAVFFPFAASSFPVCETSTTPIWLHKSRQSSSLGDVSLFQGWRRAARAPVPPAGRKLPNQLCKQLPAPVVATEK